MAINTQKGSVACSFIEKPVQRWIISAHTDMTIWKTWQTSMGFRCMQLVSNLRSYLVGDNGKTSIDTPNYMWLYKSNHPASVLTILFTIRALIVTSLSIIWFMEVEETFGNKFMKLSDVQESCHSDVWYAHCCGFCFEQFIIWLFFPTFQNVTVTTMTKSIGSLISRSSCSQLSVNCSCFTVLQLSDGKLAGGLGWQI